MAATESAPSPSTEESTSQIAKPEKLAKIEKPDEEKYKRDVAEADKELSAVTEKLVPYPSPQLNTCHAFITRARLTIECFAIEN